MVRNVCKILRFSFQKLFYCQCNYQTTSCTALTKKTKRTPYWTPPKSGKSRNKESMRSHLRLAVWWNDSGCTFLLTRDCSIWACRKWSEALEYTNQSPQNHTFLYYRRLRSTTQLLSTTSPTVPSFSSLVPSKRVKKF